MSYKKLKVWQVARKVSIDIHKMSLELPSFELYECGSQIRRSSKSIRANIVEGYGRRKYTNDYLRFLIYAHSSVDETRDHLETLHETGSLQNQQIFENISEQLNILGKMLFRFIQRVEKDNH
ncbi:MAG: four helix bundle protein [Balneolaceae bacterium]|nr:four helix bundle protein [Balneolaceae bacterium]